MLQKELYEIELAGGTHILMRSDFGFDNKNSKPNLAQVRRLGRGVDFVKEGDFVLCHHNAFNRENQGYIYGDLDMRDSDGLSLFSLEKDLIWLTVTEDGKTHPLPEYMTVERLEKKVDTTLIEIPDSVRKTDMNLFKVVEAGSLCEFVNPGDLVLCEKHSDVTIRFTWNKKVSQAIRVMYRDVLAILPQNSECYNHALS